MSENSFFTNLKGNNDERYKIKRFVEDKESINAYFLKTYDWCHSFK